jgi:hypothetical protein
VDPNQKPSEKKIENVPAIKCVPPDYKRRDGGKSD